MDFSDHPPNEPQPAEGQPPAMPQSTTSGMAIASLVLGISGFILWFLTAIPAIILGILAIRSIDQSGGRIGGKGLAIGGIVTGSISMLCCLAFLPALLLPAVQAAREAARANQSLNNIKQINLAMLNYESVNQTLPVAGTDAAGNKPNLSWRVHLLPYLEGGSTLYQQFHLDEPWDSPHNLSLLPLIPKTYQNPNLPQDGKTNYLAVVGPGAAFRGEDPGPRLADFSDGRLTIWLVEANEDQAVEWTRPDDWQFDPNDPGRGLGDFRPGGFLVGLMDGSAQRLDPSVVEAGELRRLMTRDAGD